MPPEERIPTVIIGAGVVGCAIAQELTTLGITPWILEAGPRIAEGTTSRNSGVIHAGLYYLPGSIKAETCIRGAHLLYEWCKRYSVPYRQVGKWVVAHKNESDELHHLYENALLSGAQADANGIRLTTSAELKCQLPDVKGDLALFSPQTGIVDPYEYSRSLLAIAETKGALLVTSCKVLGVEPTPSGGYELRTTRGAILTEWVINSAGLDADQIARMVGIDQYQIHPCRGNYFRWNHSPQFAHLVYPVKKKGSPGLGVHLTLGLDGSCRLGPDAEYVHSREDLSDCNPQKKQAFFEAASQYLVGIRMEDLEYDSCGIRPKLRSPTDPYERDFVVSLDRPGWINLIGIESPGLTASRAIAERVIQLIKK